MEMNCYNRTIWFHTLPHRMYKKQNTSVYPDSQQNVLNINLTECFTYKIQ